MFRSLAFVALVVFGVSLVAPPLRAETVVRGDLSRRPFLGAQLNPAPNGGIEIVAVLPGGSAEKAGLQAGDVITAVDDEGVDSPTDFGTALFRKRAGDTVRFLLRRGDTISTMDVTLVGPPLETADDFDILYDTVEIEGATLRSILMRPRGASGRLPAVLFIQGLTCGSIENMQGALTPVSDLLKGYVAAGYVVMRCEKIGVGDSGGEPCSEIGFLREVQGFLGALRRLKQYDFVDPDRVFLFGHSMGGIEAPIVAVEEPVAGIMVYGTGVIGWSEYLIDNARRQARLGPETDLAELEATLPEQARFQHYVFEDSMSVAEVVEAHPDLQPIAAENFPDGVHGFTRHISFFRELNAIVPARSWAEVACPVFAIYGEYDFATSAYDHEYIAAIVNQNHPGNGTWKVMPKMFHAFNLHESMEETLASPWTGPFGTELLTDTVAWMQDVLAGK